MTGGHAAYTLEPSILYLMESVLLRSAWSTVLCGTITVYTDCLSRNESDPIEKCYVQPKVSPHYDLKKVFDAY